MNIHVYIYVCIRHVTCVCCFITYFLLDLVETELPFASSALPDPIPRNSSRSVGHHLDIRPAIIGGSVGFCIQYFVHGSIHTDAHKCTHTNTHTCIVYMYTHTHVETQVCTVRTYCMYIIYTHMYTIHTQAFNGQLCNTRH